MKKIEVVAAVIKSGNKYLCCKRGPKGETALKWEFPGGKIELGETHREALHRELKEELSLEVEIDKLLITITHQYKTFHLTMHCYVCTAGSTNYYLHEHVEARWLSKEEMSKLDWADADIPVLKKLSNVIR